MIDLHSHILPGLDDGARTLAECVEIAQAAAADGISSMAATPHVRGDYPTRSEVMQRVLVEAREALAAADVPVQLLPGGEIALEMLPMLDETELRGFGLGGNRDYVLLEFPYYGWPLQLGHIVFDLRVKGISPVLAHPERNAEVQASPQRLRPLVDQGALVQLTAASLDGRLGRAAQKAARQLLDLELAHLVASDVHRPDGRGVELTRAAAMLDDDALARWLIQEVPAAIVAATGRPQRPRRRRRRFFLTH